MSAPKVRFTVHHNEAHPYVMAFVCSCGAPGIGFGDEAYGLFDCECAAGCTSTVLAS